MELSINSYLRKLVDENASDLHFKVGCPPILRVDGELLQLEARPLSIREVEELARSLVPEERSGEVLQVRQMDLAYSVPGLGRFRTNIYRQRGTVGIALRYIPRASDLEFEGLNLPLILRDLADLPRGLVIVTGVTGSGKTTTLACMINHINRSRRCHVVTIEDPIEFLHHDEKSIVSQREIGTDTEDFNVALKHVVRQDPDVILIGEMRDVATVESAIRAADTGHLVFTTLHTTDTVQTINRIINFFPAHRHNQIRLDLSSTLKGVVGLRLLPRADGKGRIPAVEVMVSTPTIRELITREEKTSKIADAIEEGASHYGMQSFDQALMKLYQEGFIHYEDALTFASSTGDFALKVRSEMPELVRGTKRGK